MQPKNHTGRPSVISRSITQKTAVIPLEERKYPASRPASGALPPSPPLATGQSSNPSERITQALKTAGYTSAPGSVGGRFCIRVITHAQTKADRYAA